MGRKRSNSLSSMLSARRRAGEILRRRRRGRPSLLSVHGLQLICVVACALSAVILGVFPSLFGFGVLEASLGEGVVGTTFAASARRLNAIQVRPDGEIPALEFLNAVDELQPAFKVMGLMFELATKEVSTNLRKLRRAYTEFVDAEYASSSSAVQSGVAGGSSSNSSPPNSPRGGGGGHLAVRSRGFVSLQDLVWGPAGRPAADLIEGAAAGGGFGWGAGDDEDGGAGGEFKASAGLPHEVDAAGRKWLPVPQPVVTYEALLWLGFGLHFMETLYGCIGDPLAGEQPALCAKRAYDVALRNHQNQYMRTIAGSLLNIVPISKEALVARTGMEHEDMAPLLAAWAVAVRPFRIAIAEFYAKHWPPHTA